MSSEAIVFVSMQTNKLAICLRYKNALYFGLVNRNLQKRLLYDIKLQREASRKFG